MLDNIYVDSEEGLIYFILTNSANLLKAYKEVMKIFDNLKNGKIKFDEIALQAAKCSIISNFS